MAASIYRLCFGLATAILLVCVGLGVTESERTVGSLPSLSQGEIALSALQFYGAGDSEQWVASMRAYTEIQPRNPAAWLALGAAYLDVDEFAPAIVACKKAIALGEPTGRSHLVLAHVYLEVGRDGLARTHARAASKKGLRLSPELRAVVGGESAS